MKKYIILSLILVMFIFNLDIVLFSVKDASILFFNKVFVSIFPFIILSDILIYYDYHIFIKNSFIGKSISKLFNINPNSSIIFILSILTSTPNNAIYIKNMLDNDEIDIDTANKILVFTYFPSIPFVIGTIGITIYNSFKIGLILYLNCIISNILIGLYFKRIKTNQNTVKKIIIKDRFFNMIKKSITKAINNSYIVLGNLIIFTIIINIITKYINTNQAIISILSGLFELTNGVNKISLLSLPIKIKILITTFILNFNGLSILFQSFGILSDYKINIKKILITKLIFSSLSVIIPILLLKLVNLFYY